MLVKRELIFKKIEDPKRKFAGIGLMLIVILALGAVIMDSGIKTISTDSDPVDFREIGGDFPHILLACINLDGPNFSRFCHGCISSSTKGGYNRK